MEDLNFFLKMLLIAAQSFILKAVTISTPASAAIGIRLITPPSRNIERISTTEWKTLTSLVCPPDFIATEVLAIAAVAGTPPSSGITMLPIPCAISSRLASRRSPFILPALAPHSRLSIIPSAAIDTAGMMRLVIFAKSKPLRIMLSSVTRLLGIAPTSATVPCSKNTMFTMSATIIPTSDDGTTAFHFFG